MKAHVKQHHLYKYYEQYKQLLCCSVTTWSRSRCGKFSINQKPIRNKSFWKAVRITKQCKPTWQTHALHYWFCSQQIWCRSYILILWLLVKNKDYIQGTEVSTSDLPMNIWLLPCTLSEQSSLARSLIITGIKTSFSTCLSLEFSARKPETKKRKKIIFLYKITQIYRNNIALLIEQILVYSICN